jgi:hypothetical protein
MGRKYGHASAATQQKTGCQSGGSIASLSRNRLGCSSMSREQFKSPSPNFVIPLAGCALARLSWYGPPARPAGRSIGPDIYAVTRAINKVAELPASHITCVQRSVRCWQQKHNRK